MADALLDKWRAVVPPQPTFWRFILYAIRPPRLRAHDGLSSRGATQTELFFDLVLALPWGALVDSPTRRNPSSSDTWHILAVAAIFNGWMGRTFFNTRYDTDSATARISAILGMTGFTAMAFGVRCTSNDDSVLVCDDNELHSVSSIFILGYGAVRSVLWINYLAVYCALPSKRSNQYSSPDSITVKGMLTGFGFSLLCCFLASGLRKPKDADARFCLFLTAVVVDFVTPFVLIPYMPAIRIHHLMGRFGRFLLICVNASVVAPLLEMPLHGGRVNLFSPLLALWPPFCLIQLHSAPIGGLLTSSRVEHFHRSYEGTTIRKIRIYGFFYLHLPLTLLISALFTRMPPWDRVSGPSGDKAIWACLLLILAAQHVLVSTQNMTHALCRGFGALLLLTLAFADSCFALPVQPTPDTTPDTTPVKPKSGPPMMPWPPASPPIAEKLLPWGDLELSLCNPAFSMLVICAVLLFEVFVDAFLGFRQAETEKVEEGADPDVPTLNALGIGYTQSLGAAPLISLHPAYTTSLDTWREGHTSGDHDPTSGDHDHTSGDHDHGGFRDANARPTLIGDPPADPSRGPSDDSSRAPLSPVVHTAAVAHRDSL
jgi:hypothetical protein